MSRQTTIAVALLALWGLGLALSGGEAQAGTQLLQNPGFEQGTVAWSRWPYEATFDVVASPVHGGARAARLNKGTPGSAYIYQDVAVSPGNTYALSGWGRLNAPEVLYLRLQVEWRNASGQVLRTDQTTLTSASAVYQPMSLGRQTAPPGAATARVQAYAYFAAPNPANPPLFDDLSFTLEPPPTPTRTSTPLADTVRLNEFLPAPQVVDWNGDGQANADDEWIELYNLGSQAVDLGQWMLDDVAGGGTAPYRIPSGVVIGPGQHLVLFRSTTGVALNDTGGDTVRLLWPDGREVDGYTYTHTSPDASFSREQDGTGAWTDAYPPSPGGPNLPATPTPTPTETATPTATSSSTVTPTPTETATPLDTPTPTATATATPSVTPTATATPSPTLPPSRPLLISEVLYDGTEPGEGDEFVEVWNPLDEAVDLSGYKVGDEEQRAPLAAQGGEGMYAFPEGFILGPGQVVVVARDAAAFRARFGRWPDFQFLGTAPEVPRLGRYAAWSTGSWALTNEGDEVLLLGARDDLVDAVAYREGDLGSLGLVGYMAAPAPRSMQRVGRADSSDLCDDFVARSPNPGEVTFPPEPPSTPPAPVRVGGQYYAFVGDLHGYSAFSGGAGPPAYAFAQARANGLHFLVLADHAHDLTPSRWASLGRAARQATEDGAFVALRGFELVHALGAFTVLGTPDYVAEGDLPASTLVPFYTWLVARGGALAQFARPTSGGFSAFAYHAAADSRVQLLEVGSGVGSGYRTAEKAYREALAAGWHVGPTNNSHTLSPAWGADTRHRTGVLTTELKANALLRALRRRRTFATEDANLVLALRCNGRWMGSQVAAVGDLKFVLTFHDPDGEVVDLFLYKDKGTSPVAQKRFAGQVEGTWRVRLPAEPGHVYWAKAVQLDGDTAYTSPIWTK